MGDGGGKQLRTPEREARRHLLKLAAYVPPAILGAMIAGPKMARAFAVGTSVHCSSGEIVVSAGGQACCPCIPSDPQYDPNRCNQERCKLGNCPACRQVVFHNRTTCERFTAACGSCTCQPVQTGSDKHATFWMCR